MKIFAFNVVRSLNFVEIVAVLGLFVNSQAQESQDVCISLPRQQTTSTTNLVGSPGKRGPKGHPGPKGDIGPEGPCVCDRNEQRRIQNELVSMREKLTELTNFVKLEHPLFKCAVGLKDRSIPDVDINTSGHCCNSAHAHYHARLDNDPTKGGTGIGAWAANPPFAGQWIQVNLKNQTRVTGVVTQGRPACACTQWVTQFKMMYSNDGANFKPITDWNGSEKIFQGNRDRNSYQFNRFNRPVTAQYFRLVVVTAHHHASLRMELITC